MIERVRQEDTNGCGIACLAMITGKTYLEVRDELVYYDGSGLANHIIDEYLADHGYAVARKFEASHWQQKKYGRTTREQWPVEPFADVHLCQVETWSDTNHFVVMLRDGTILDPYNEHIHSLDAYKDVWNIAGIVKVTP